MEHGMTAPGGGVQARLNLGYQTSDVLEHCGQGSPQQLYPLCGPGMPTQTTPPRKQDLPGESVVLTTEAVSNGHRYKGIHPLQSASQGDTTP